MTASSPRARGLPAQSALLAVAVVGSLFQWQQIAEVAGVNLRPSFIILCGAIVAYFTLGSVPMVNTRFVSILPRSLVGVGIATLALAMANIGFGSNLISLAALLEMVSNFVLAGLFGVMIAAEMSRPGGPRFAGLALVCVTSLLTVLFVPVFIQGANPIATVSQGIRSGDSTLIQFGLFRTAFRTSADEDVQANVRHSITVIVMVAFYLSLLTSANESQLSRLMRLAGSAFAGAWLVLSLSRTSWLAAAVPGIVFVAQQILESIRQGRGRLWQWLLMVGVLLALQPASALLIDRFTSTASYETRFESLNESLESLGDRVLFGGPAAVLRPHNMVLSFWLAGGVVAAVGAALIASEAFKLGWRAAMSALDASTLDRAAAYAQLGLASTAFVRIFTSGGVTMHLAAWLSLGAAGGVSAGQKLRPTRAETTQHADPRQPQLQT